jgi:putative Mg2+ transporter-C (MgtC) family protein
MSRSEDADNAHRADLDRHRDRLMVTIVAGVLIGYNRSEHGKTAGLRTMVLVCLAASLAMIQLNVLLPLVGRSSNSFVMNDLMRLPLGILTEVGFIGGRAILRRGDITVGVTTAATLWLVTVIGLCIGGGQIELGLAGSGIGLFALWGLHWIEQVLPREQRATLAVEVDDHGPSDEDLHQKMEDSGLSIVGTRISFSAEKHREFIFDLRETRSSSRTVVPLFVQAIANEAGVVSLRWRPPA